MADAMVCIDTKSEAGDDSRRHIHGRNGREACHILRRCAETCFIATEEDIGASIDEHNCIQRKRFYQVGITFSDRSNAQLFEGINSNILPSPREKLSQGALGEI